jgi:hypothetical protein
MALGNEKRETKSWLIALGWLLVVIVAVAGIRLGAPPDNTAMVPSTTPVEGTFAPPIDEHLEGVPDSCPVTAPGQTAFDPPPAVPTALPPLAPPGTVWYGTTELWKAINPHGEVWASQSGRRMLWWSEGYSPADGRVLTLTATHLDGASPTVETSGVAVGVPPYGDAMMVIILVPEQGCWQLEASYNGVTLGYIVWVGS